MVSSVFLALAERPLNMDRGQIKLSLQKLKVILVFLVLFFQISPSTGSSGRGFYFQQVTEQSAGNAQISSNWILKYLTPKCSIQHLLNVLQEKITLPLIFASGREQRNARVLLHKSFAKTSQKISPLNDLINFSQ